MAKWCTSRGSIYKKLGSITPSSKLKISASDFSKSEYEDLMKEKITEEDKAWLKNLGSSSNKKEERMAKWCAAVLNFVFTDEKDSDEYKRTLQYCVKKSHQSELN